MGFKQNIGWEFISKYGRNKFVKTSYIYLVIVPLLAKLLSKLENPLKIILSGIEYKFDLSLPFNWILFYFAALAFTIGYIIFFVRAPNIIKENINFSDFSDAKKNFNHLSGYLANMGINDYYIEELGLDTISVKSYGGDYATQVLKGKKKPKELEKILQKIEVYYCLYSNFKDFNIQNKDLNDSLSESGYISLSFWAIYNYADRIFSSNWKILSLIFFIIGTILISIVFIQNMIYVLDVLI